MTAEVVTERQIAPEPDLPKVSIAKLLMGKRGYLRREIPDYFNLEKYPEFQPFVDHEYSNGRTVLKFTDAETEIADRYLDLRNREAEELVKQSRETSIMEYRRDVLRQNGLEH